MGDFIGEMRAAYEEGTCKGTFDSCGGGEGGGRWIHVSLGVGWVTERGWRGGGKSNMEVILPS